MTEVVLPLHIQDAVARLTTELGEHPTEVAPPGPRQSKFTVRWANGVYCYITRDGLIEAPLIAETALRIEMMVAAIKGWHAFRGNPFDVLATEEGWTGPTEGEWPRARTTDNKILVTRGRIDVVLTDFDDHQTCEIAREIKALFQ